MDTRQEFKAWLRRHRRHLQFYSPDEIAAVALAAGFSMEEIAPGVCDQVSHLKRLLTFWESPFSGNWLHVVDYERGIDKAA